MDEIIPVKTPAKRRHFSNAFKTWIVAACDQPGASIAGVALAHGLNVNMVHRWHRLAKDKGAPVSKQPDFLPVPMSTTISSIPASVVIKANGVEIHWPLAHIEQSIAWLRAVQA